MTELLKASTNRCPICQHKITVAPPDGQYIWCRDCNILRTKYNYDAAQYSTSYALNYLEYAKSPVNTPLNLFRLGLISRWLKREAQILDVGCCVGEFIRFAEKYYICHGFEPNPVAAREAVKRTHSGITTELNGSRSFDCVTLFDVIEHIQEPANLLRHIHLILRVNGIVALTTPNLDAVRNDGALRIWKHYKPKEHLFLYGASSLCWFLEHCGFKVIHTGHEESDIRPGNPMEDLLTCVARKV